MKVLINGLQLGKNNSGVQYYTKHLYNAIQEIQHKNIETQLYLSSCKINTRFLILRCPFLFSVSPLLSTFKGRLSRIINENFCLSKYIKQQGFHIFHSPNYILHFFIKSPSIVTIHDLITFDFPKLCQWESVLYFKLLLPRSIKKAYKIIVVSETTKLDIIKRFKVSESKISVIHLGVSPIFSRTLNPFILRKYHVATKYILFVGNIEPKKNLVRLIKAFHILVITKNISHQLVIAGKKGWKYKEVFRTVERLKLQDKVIFTGYVPEEDLPVLYSMANLFVFPSIYEGFGIPPLEAMACETPVLASNAGALPETTGENCLLVDPYNEGEIADGIYLLLNDEKLRTHYVKKGIKWVEQFTWDSTARMTLEVYRQVMVKVMV